MAVFGSLRGVGVGVGNESGEERSLLSSSSSSSLLMNPSIMMAMDMGDLINSNNNNYNEPRFIIQQQQQQQQQLEEEASQQQQQQQQYILHDSPSSSIPCPGPYPSRSSPEIMACSQDKHQFVFQVIQGYHCCTLATTTTTTKDYTQILPQQQDQQQDQQQCLKFQKIHQTIHGEASGDRVGLGDGNGNGIAFSGNGKVVVVASRFHSIFNNNNHHNNYNNNDGNDAQHHHDQHHSTNEEGSGADRSGQVRVYHETNFGWQQLGQTLDGNIVAAHGVRNHNNKGGAHYGFSVATSIRGTVLAVGAIRHSGPLGPYQGRVQIYHLWQVNDFVERWEPMGDALEGIDMLDYFGYSLSLSDDGTTLAVGAIQHVGGSSSTYTGYVHVYHWIEEEQSWNLLGQPLVGKHNGDQHGNAVSISANGRVVAVGAKFHSGHNNTVINGGSVAVYLLALDGTWTMIGHEIHGDKENGHFGSSVALSDDGTVVVVGAENSSNALHQESAGLVRVFRYNMHSDKWVQLGKDIEGESEGHALGVSVSIGGNVIAIGAIHADNPNNAAREAGQTKLLRYNAVNNEWEPIGPTIYGNNEMDHLGHSVALSKDGFRIAVGVPLADSPVVGKDAGCVTIYDVPASPTTSII